MVGRRQLWRAGAWLITRSSLCSALAILMARSLALFSKNVLFAWRSLLLCVFNWILMVRYFARSARIWLRFLARPVRQNAGLYPPRHCQHIGPLSATRAGGTPPPRKRRRTAMLPTPGASRRGLEVVSRILLSVNTARARKPGRLPRISTGVAQQLLGDLVAGHRLNSHGQVILGLSLSSPRSNTESPAGTVPRGACGLSRTNFSKPRS